MDSAITIDGLTKHYGGVAALSELTLDVPAGSIFGFLGANGAGKTTTLKILAGLTRPTSGTATVNGVPVGVQGAHRAQLGYLAQEPRFYGWMTGRQTLEYVATFYPDQGGRRRVDELLELVGLTDAADRRTRTYSGGMRQRLGIAQALVGDPAVIVLDEPAAALDPLGRHDVLALLRQLRGNKTVFYSTHIIDDVQRVSDHVAILDHGRLVVSAPTADLVRRSATGTVRVGLLGADDGTAARLAGLPGVSRVDLAGRSGDEWQYDLVVADGRLDAVQRSVMGLAAETGLIVASNRQETLDLEAAFLRIVNEERAA
jgi:ABC-2 type transport system ATP-binding protein